MAFGSIELTTISRAQDYSAIKHNEDNKAVADQTNGQIQVQKNEVQRTREVHSSDDTQWHDDKPDARKKGNGEYYGDGGKRRKKQGQQPAVVKGRGGFDIKI
ncbi:MAG: hypothetical protein NC541_09630 [bacterium]|nr:hypothetical protein [bacterium]